MEENKCASKMTSAFSKFFPLKSSGPLKVTKAVMTVIGRLNYRITSVYKIDDQIYTNHKNSIND